MAKVTKAIIPAAGFGTRFLPASKALPKEMFPIVDTPTLQYIVEEAVASGIKEILIILGRNKKAIEDHFDKSFELEYTLKKNNKLHFLKVVQDISGDANIYYARQKEMKGSGNALLIAEAFVKDEPFAVMFGDDLIYNPNKPCLSQLIKAYETTGQTIVGCQTVPESETHKYGIVAPGAIKGKYAEIKKFVEKPKENPPSQLACMGRYILTPEIFEAIRNSEPLPGGEIGLTGAIEDIAQTYGAYSYDFEGRRYDIGDKCGYIEATIEYALRDDELREKVQSYLKDAVSKF